MKRRGFLQSLGLASARIAFGPLMSFSSPRKIIYKLDKPVFTLFYTDGEKNTLGELMVKSVGKVANMYKGTLKDLIRKHPDDEIFFYEEGTSEIFVGNKINYVRACAFRTGPNIKILTPKNYEV